MNRIDQNNKNAIDWSKETGIVIIYIVNDKFKLEELYKNFNNMPYNLQKESDRKCIEYFGCTNKNHYLKQYQKLQ